MTMLIDGHNDVAREYDADLDAVDLTSVVPDLHIDLKRLEAGGVTGQFWSVYVSPELFAGPSAVTATLEQIDFVRRLVARYPDPEGCAGGCLVCGLELRLPGRTKGFAVTTALQFR